MSAPEPFPWHEVMKFGFGVLHLSPSEFWSMSVRELEAAMQVHFGSAEPTVSRQWLNEIIKQNPDGNLSRESP